MNFVQISGSFFLNTPPALQILAGFMKEEEMVLKRSTLYLHLFGP